MVALFSAANQPLKGIGLDQGDITVEHQCHRLGIDLRRRGSAVSDDARRAHGDRVDAGGRARDPHLLQGVAVVGDTARMAWQASPAAVSQTVKSCASPIAGP